MKLELDNGAYIRIKPSPKCIDLYCEEGLDNDCTLQTLTRKQGIELIAMLMVNISPAPAQEEIDEAVVKLIFSNLKEAE